MIEHLAARHFTQRAYRLQGVADSNEKALADLRVKDVRGILTVLRVSLPDDPAGFLDGPFRPRSQYRPRTRFSDGSFPVFYSALERATTRAEMRHHTTLKLLGVGSIPGTSVFMREVECTFTGDIKDLLGEATNIPALIGEESAGAYDTCNTIGAEAQGEELDGLLTPSARETGGSCLPVFVRGSLASPALGTWVTFTHNAADGSIACAEVA